jgi:EAL domain-containing protein (putative c-di-GMP-specific phosphodiesterase class I)
MTHPHQPVGRRWIIRVSRIWFGGFAMRDEAPDVRRRARVVIGSVILASLAIGVVVAAILIGSANTLVSHTAEERAQHSVSLLVTVGANMPNLTPSVTTHGVSAVAKAKLDSAVGRGRAARLLSSLTIWDASGSALYSSDGISVEANSPTLQKDLVQALRGHAVTTVSPSELDRSSGQPTGTLDAFEPLIGRGKHTYGALELELPLQPVLAQTGQVRGSIVRFVIGALALIWVLLLPFTSRAAIAIARASAPGRRRLLADFQRALDNDEIELFYQPQITPAERTVEGVEALVRWNRNGKHLTPDKFLATIEDSALMALLTGRVIDLATAQLAAWRDAGHTFRVAINLSATDLEDGLAARIEAALVRHSIPSELLTVEVTETAVARDATNAQKVLTSISDLGVQISVDDFGTGHASISRMHRFPIDQLKIDRSFVTPADKHTRNYLAAIISFGQTIGVRVVAEGVEDAETLDCLRGLCCDVAQGYHIARPMPADRVHDWLSYNTPFRSARSELAMVAA